MTDAAYTFADWAVEVPTYWWHLAGYTPSLSVRQASQRYLAPEDGIALHVEMRGEHTDCHDDEREQQSWVVTAESLAFLAAWVTALRTCEDPETVSALQLAVEELGGDWLEERVAFTSSVYYQHQMLRLPGLPFAPFLTYLLDRLPWPDPFELVQQGGGNWYTVDDAVRHWGLTFAQLADALEFVATHGLTLGTLTPAYVEFANDPKLRRQYGMQLTAADSTVVWKLPVARESLYTRMRRIEALLRLPDAPDTDEQLQALYTRVPEAACSSGDTFAGFQLGYAAAMLEHAPAALYHTTARTERL